MQYKLRVAIYLREEGEGGGEGKEGGGRERDRARGKEKGEKYGTGLGYSLLSNNNSERYHLGGFHPKQAKKLGINLPPHNTEKIDTWCQLLKLRIVYISVTHTSSCFSNTR